MNNKEFFPGKKWERTQKAVLETIRICKDRNVLKEYLENREKGTKK